MFFRSFSTVMMTSTRHTDRARCHCPAAVTRRLALLTLLLLIPFVNAANGEDPAGKIWPLQHRRRRFPFYDTNSVDEEMDEARRCHTSSNRRHSKSNDDNKHPTVFVGRGREFSIFDNAKQNKEGQSSENQRKIKSPSRGGAAGTNDSYSNNRRHPYTTTENVDDTKEDSSFIPPKTPRARFSYKDGSRFNNNNNNNSKQQQHQRSFLSPDWWNKNIQNLPKIQLRLEPTTTLKIRKTFRPLKTVVRLSAHFNTQQGVWQFRSSWEDALIGGKLTLAGRELQLAKSWQLSVGPVEDLVTRLRLRAAVDWSTLRGYVRLGFRTERLSPINVMEGFSLLKQIPLDGNEGHIKLEVKANFALPEPELEYSTETHRSLIGMGDIEVGIEELNLLLDY